MNRILTLTYLALYILTSHQSYAQCSSIKTLAKCPMEGCGGDALLNRVKNRADAPKQNSFQKIDFPFFRTLHKTELKKWKDATNRNSLITTGEGHAVQIVGLLGKVKRYNAEGAHESCNCNLDGEANNDFHLVIIEHIGDGEERSVTAEMTPRMRKTEHPKWTYKKLQQLDGTTRRVRVTGWLMFDSKHAGQDSPKRISHWEIHPATRFEVETTPNHWMDLDDWNG